MWQVDSQFLNDVKDFATNVVLPICSVLIPLVIFIYTRLRAEILKAVLRFSISFERKLKDWEKEYSGQMNSAITFFLDMIKSNPYNRVDQVVLLALENGLSTASNLHVMFWSVTAEDTSIGRIHKKVSIQRVPYTALVPLTQEMVRQRGTNDKKCVDFPDVPSCPILMGLPVFENVGSSIVTNITTPDGYLMGMLFFNYQDPGFNAGDLAKEVESMKEAKTFIEGEILAYNRKRDIFISTEQK